MRPERSFAIFSNYFLFVERGVGRERLSICRKIGVVVVEKSSLNRRVNFRLGRTGRKWFGSMGNVSVVFCLSVSVGEGVGLRV
jgi:hypothetical protein